MSSETVTTGSSRLRQFGLYRTIDSRTEEFLKLSRRRQIRQGCACAAVSTAITVTVVVMVLLIYEYGFRMDTEMVPKFKHRPNWISMLNDTDSGFDKNHHKPSFNLDRNTLKLLPIILKAIKQNKYLEKVMDENSSQPPNDKHTTDFPIQRNVFTDARNWIRMPASRMYAIEYKTSPIVFFKSRNLETFAKARKLMESQRIMNYLDRMLSEKVTYGSKTQVVNGESSSTVKSTTPDEIPIKKFLQYIIPGRVGDITPTRKIEPPESTDPGFCACPNNLGEILKKLAYNIEQLLPDNSEHKLDILKPCSKSKIASTTRKTITTKVTPKTMNKPTKATNATTVFDHRNQQNTPKLDFRPESKIANVQNMISNIPNIQSRIPHKDLANIIISSYNKKHGCKENNSANCPNKSTTMKSVIPPTEYITLHDITTTRPMTPVTTTKFWRLTTAESFVMAHQLNEDILSGNKDIKKIYEFADVATAAPSKPATFIDKHIEEYKTKGKKMTLKQFLQKYKESQTNNTPFGGALSDVYKPQISEFPAMKTFTKRDPSKEQNPKAGSSTVETLLNNEISNMQVENNTRTRSVGPSVTMGEKDLENMFPEFVDTDAILMNETALAESLRKLGISSQEISHSIMSQSRPSFLEIRRNEGRHEDPDYDPDTNLNHYVYD